MSLDAMVTDLLAASDRWRANNHTPPPPPGESIEDHLVFVHITDQKDT